MRGEWPGTSIIRGRGLGRLVRLGRRQTCGVVRMLTLGGVNVARILLLRVRRERERGSAFEFERDVVGPLEDCEEGVVV